MAIKFGITEWGMPGDGHFPIRIAKMAGLDGVQLDLGAADKGYPLAQKYVREMCLEEAKRHEIEFPSLALDDLNVHGFVEGRNGAHGKIAYDTMRLGVETAAAMGIGTIMIPNFFDNLVVEKRHAENTVEALAFCCDLAAKQGITVASESALDPERHLDILDQVDRPNLGVFFDSMNYRFFEDFDQISVLERLYPRMVPQLHVKDGVDALSGSLLGEGGMDFFAQAKWLMDKHFSGWVILENYHSKPPIMTSVDMDQLESLKSDMRIMKKAFSPLSP